MAKRTTALRQAADVLGLLRSGGPACCNVAVTNVCNATCDFCGFAKNKGLVSPGTRRFIDADRLPAALDILYARGVRYLVYSGGEPLLHPALPQMVARATRAGMRVAAITNGSVLSERMLARFEGSGLRTMYISIDAADAVKHETNRGLRCLFDRVGRMVPVLRAMGVQVVASVAISRLVDNYDGLAEALQGLGFDAVTFAYPKTSGHSSSLVYSADSELIDFTAEELADRFDSIKALKRRMTVQNPTASLDEMKRHVRGERQRFPCVGGHKYFYMDWEFDLYRCDFWAEPMCSVWDLAATESIRDGCTNCMSVCYRDSSVFMGFPIALGDAFQHAKRGRLGAAVRALASETARASVGTLWQERRLLRRMARTG